MGRCKAGEEREGKTAGRVFKFMETQHAHDCLWVFCVFQSTHEMRVVGEVRAHVIQDSIVRLSGGNLARGLGEPRSLCSCPISSNGGEIGRQRRGESGPQATCFGNALHSNSLGHRQGHSQSSCRHGDFLTAQTVNVVLCDSEVGRPLLYGSLWQEDASSS